MTLQESFFSLKGNEYLKRQIEVALTGDHKITVIGYPDNGKKYLQDILKDQLTFIEPCKCNELNIFNYCDCQYLPHLKYERARQLKQSLSNPIIGKLLKPTKHDYKNISEDFESVLNRIARVYNFITDNRITNKSKQNLKISKSAYDLLDTAIDKLSLTLRNINNIKSVAVTIALMDFSLEILPQYIAEAIQYQNIDILNIRKDL